MTAHENQLLLWSQLESYKPIMTGVSINSMTLFDSQFIVVATEVCTITLMDLEMHQLMTFDL